MQELSGSTPTANLLGGGIDEVFQRTDSAGARSFLSGALGSTLALTDSIGTVQTQYTYEPFGSTTSTGSPSTNTFAYTGRELDATGLYYYRARYYHPQLGRFISEDPIGLQGGINQYAYVENGPTNSTDPLGMDKNQKKCPPVPFHPGGANIDQNIAQAESDAPLLNNLFGAPLIIDDYYHKWRNKGPWDYKQGWTLNDYGSLDRQSPFEDFGNFNYGATAAALGVPESVALRLAGWASTRADPSRAQQLGHWWGGPPYGDDPDDQIQIELGYQYYRQGCHE